MFDPSGRCLGRPYGTCGRNGRVPSTQVLGYSPSSLRDWKQIGLPAWLTGEHQPLGVRQLLIAPMVAAMVDELLGGGQISGR